MIRELARYEVRRRPTRLVHIFEFRDREAQRVHSDSRALKDLSGVRYPECVEPVEFIEYELVATNR